jgi:hypothetical protein
MSGHQAVSFSGPGITTLSAFYEFKDETIQHSFINVVPKLDPIPTIDKPSGSVFMIPCQAGVIACHSISRTQCMLAVQCGEYDNYFDFCTKTAGYTEAEMQDMLKLGRPYDRQT